MKFGEVSGLEGSKTHKKANLDKNVAVIIEISGHIGWTWYHMPVTSALWEAKVGRPLETRSLRLAWPTWQNPVSIRNIRIKVWRSGSRW